MGGADTLRSRRWAVSYGHRWAVGSATSGPFLLAAIMSTMNSGRGPHRVCSGPSDGLLLPRPCSCTVPGDLDGGVGR
jgi:hypothetical protein